MALLVALRTEPGAAGPKKYTTLDWLIRRWYCLIEWLTEPIPFPAQWPVLYDPWDDYNREDNDDNVHERSAAES